jgi:hypothetical protein
MGIGKAVAIVGIWFAVVGALFATADSIGQIPLGVVGFICAAIATALVAEAGNDTSKEETDDETSRAQETPDPR